jgi:hypothetical protein
MNYRFYFGNAYLALIGTKLLVLICKQLRVSLFQLIIVSFNSFNC